MSCCNEIPGRYPLELLEGFAMDATAHQYRNLADTLQYCYYVAGVVGIMMAYVMGTRDPAALQRATDLGIAFQLTNISRDVHEDAEVNRIYLPGDWLAEAGVAADQILEPQHAAALAAGGTDNGAPGLREDYHPNYYGAFFLDPDGNNIEAVCHRPQ